MIKTLLILVIFLVSCNYVKELDSAERFINKAKTINLDILFNVAIEARNESDEVYHYYYSHILQNNDTLLLPSFEYFDKFINDDSYFLADVYKFGKANGVEKEKSLAYAKRYAQKLQTIYWELGVINTVSNPNSGDFIQFTLNEKCDVFFLRDRATLTPYWRNYFSKMKKVDEMWYYECKYWCAANYSCRK